MYSLLCPAYTALKTRAGLRGSTVIPTAYHGAETRRQSHVTQMHKVDIIFIPTGI